MVKLLGKTIRQLSEELKLSKQAINQRINSINDFRSKHTYKVKNHLEIDNQGVKMLANFDKQKRQERQTNRQAENDKDKNIDHILLKQQIANLQQALDQQQKLQIATVSENHRLKEHVRKLSGLLEPSSVTQQQQSNDKDDALSNNANTRHSKDKNDKQNENRVDEYNNRQKKVSKNKVNNSWWRFW